MATGTVGKTVSAEPPPIICIRRVWSMAKKSAKPPSDAFIPLSIDIFIDTFAMSRMSDTFPELAFSRLAMSKLSCGIRQSATWTDPWAA
jgi:hypothetical protein